MRQTIRKHESEPPGSLFVSTVAVKCGVEKSDIQMEHYKLCDLTTSPAMTLELPCNNLRRGLTIGDYAKLVFIRGSEEPRECLWVLVTGKTGAGDYAGLLAEAARHGDGIKYGDLVAFSWFHIIDVELRERRVNER